MTAEERDELITSHLWQVDSIARRLKGRLPSQIELEELKSAGHLGLVKAADSFDPSRGVQFNTYAEPRIRGAMIDGLRALASGYRDHRKGFKFISVLTESLSHISAESLRVNAQKDGARAHDAFLKSPDFYIAQLTAREQQVVVAYFCEEKSLKEIGAQLGVTESRASQIKSGAVNKLRGILTR